MWPDKKLAPESALVGRTQLAPRSPPPPHTHPLHTAAWLCFPAQTGNPAAACTLTSPPGAEATSYSSNSQSRTRLFFFFFFPSSTWATPLFRKGKLITKIHAEECVWAIKGASCLPPGEDMYMKKWLMLRAWAGGVGGGGGGGTGSQNKP